MKEDDKLYRNFRQDDPQYNKTEAWPASEYPGAAYHYMRESGFVVTSLAIMLRKWGIEKEGDTGKFNPLVLLERLKEKRAYNQFADMDIYRIQELYPLQYLGPVDYSYDVLKECFEKEIPCLLTVKGERDISHFIVPDELTGDDVLVIDPLHGERYLSGYEKIYTIRRFRKCRDGMPESFFYVCGNRYPRMKSPEGYGPRVALTFDDAPDEKNTPALLDVLKENGVKATFFIIGEEIKDREAVLRRIAEEGHSIGNHTLHHESLAVLSEEEYTDTLNSTSELIRECCGVSPTLMRPPMGIMTESKMKLAERLGYKVTGWTLDTNDWKIRDKDCVAAAVLEYVSDGEVVLMHVTHSSSVEAAKIIIPGLARRGYRMVTLEEMLRTGD